jgi:hypothetical protein
MTNTPRFRLALAVLLGIAGASCSKTQQSLVLFSLTASPPNAALNSVVLTVGEASKTFSNLGGLSSTAIELGVYVSVTGHATVSASAGPVAGCTYQAMDAVDIPSAGATVRVSLVLTASCGDAGAPAGSGGGGGGATAGTSGSPGEGGAGGSSAGSSGATAGTGGAAAGTTGTAGHAGTGGGGAAGTAGAAGHGGTGGGGTTGTAGAAGHGGTAGGGTTGTAGAAGHGAAGAGGGVVSPPSLGRCIEYDHDAPADLPCVNGTGDWAVGSVAFSPDGKLFVSAAQDARVKVWNFDGRNLTEEGHVFSLSRQGYIAFSPDGTSLAAGERTRVSVWTVATWAGKPALSGISGDVYTVQFTPDSQGIVSGDSDKNLYLHRLDTATMTSIPNLPSIPYALDVSRDGRYVAVGYSNGTLQIFQIQSNALVTAPVATISVTSMPINTLRYSPDGTLLAVGSDDSYVRFYATPVASASTPVGKSPQPDSQQGIQGLDFSPDTRYLVVATGTPFAGGAGSLWDVAGRAQIGGVAQGTSYLMSAAYAPTGKAVAFGEVGCGQVMLCAD